MLERITEEEEKKLKERIRHLSLEEKIGQLVQYGRIKERERELISEGKLGSLLNVSGAGTMNELQSLILQSKPAIPLMIGDDVIHGYKTIFPIPLAESCSWDLALMEETAAIAAREAATEGIHIVFAPMVDISRDPRWGRVAEGAGEDPYLGSEIAKARVRGFQRNDWEGRPWVTACPKHFLGYGAAEGGRDYNTVDLSERSIRETYLPPFQAAIEEGAGSLMCSFNDLNGLPSSANSFLLRKIAGEELGFKGVLISDWESIEELIFHGVAENKEEAALKAIYAGVDLDMHSGCYQENLQKLVEEGKVPEDLIDEAVLRVLRLKKRLGLFDHPFTDPGLAQKIIRSPEHIATARIAARKSIVLLKNEENLLPISKSVKSLAVIGPLADDRENPLGCWSCKGSPEHVVTVMEGLRETFTETEIFFEKGSDILAEIPEGIERAKRIAQKSEVVVMVLGESREMSGENHNRAFLDIPEAQRRLLQEVYRVNQRIILVLMNGRPLILTWEDRHIPAILEAWHLGDETGHAIADVLSGDYNPSGKLTISFPRSVGQIPIYYNHKRTGRPFFQKYQDEEETPLYPFGSIE
ncbi:MAG: glycoside hydrolase family 3 C-terminal domain-containing protein [Thermicanus sp.]|nr:glycoside hydrolase family 3 C-terminal domain-containing protein [Thermicanus sp.]